MCPASLSSVCTRWVRLLKALASSMTRIGLPSLHDLGANLIPGDPSGWEPHGRAECSPALLGHDREGIHYPRSRAPTRRDNSASRPTNATGPTMRPAHRLACLWDMPGPLRYPAVKAQAGG